jgi:hypothetical protein
MITGHSRTSHQQTCSNQIWNDGNRRGRSGQIFQDVSSSKRYSQTSQYSTKTCVTLSHRWRVINITSVPPRTQQSTASCSRARWKVLKQKRSLNSQKSLNSGGICVESTGILILTSFMGTLERHVLVFRLNLPHVLVTNPTSRYRMNISRSTNLARQKSV